MNHRRSAQKITPNPTHHLRKVRFSLRDRLPTQPPGSQTPAAFVILVESGIPPLGLSSRRAVPQAKEQRRRQREKRAAGNK